LLDICGQPFEEQGAHDVWREGHAGAGEEALEVAENFRRRTVVRGVGGEEGAQRGQRVWCCASEDRFLELVVCGVPLIVQEVADGQKELGWKVGDQHMEFGGLGGDVPEEEFLLHLKKPFRQAGQRADW